MTLGTKKAIKDLLGDLPYAAELYWRLRQPGKPITDKFTLTQLQRALPTWRLQAEASPLRSRLGKKILLFGTLRYWLEQTALLGLAFAGQGHAVTLAYLPYGTWQKAMDRFDLRRQNIYTQEVLKLAGPLLEIVPFLSFDPVSLPEVLDTAIQQLALRDTQYTLQVEKVPLDSELYRLRLARNRQAAIAALAWIKTNSPDVVVIPNGTILEFGALYQVARFTHTPVVTYEYGEQRERIWLAQNAEVMRQDTDALWQKRQGQPLTDEQLTQARQLFAARQRASLWENFARRWQGVPSEGGERVRLSLHLDHRPVLLLATNVIGDSLTLGRQVFSDSMTEWIEKTVQYLAGRSEVQFVIRIHPGELVTKGPSVADVVLKALGLSIDRVAELPEHIHLIPADARVNTYDLVEIADLGLVYTTTVGMEMVMSGVPVIAVGNTHYRSKGFTLDPASWDAYFDTLGKAITDPAPYRPTRQQVELAWNYAYRFFFEYPHPFPWHVVHFWKDESIWSLERVLSPEGQAMFGKTFQYLAGEPVEW
jgi:hypothetical protein